MCVCLCVCIFIYTRTHTYINIRCSDYRDGGFTWAKEKQILGLSACMSADCVQSLQGGDKNSPTEYVLYDKRDLLYHKRDLYDKSDLHDKREENNSTEYGCTYIHIHVCIHTLYVCNLSGTAW